MLPKLYDFTLSIRCQIVRLALVEKAVDFVVQPVDIEAGEQLQSGYGQINPQRSVPTFELGHLRLLDTLEIIRFIDSNFPGRKLMPIDFATADIVNDWIQKPSLRSQVADVMLYDPNSKTGPRFQASLALRMQTLEKMIMQSPFDQFLRGKLENHKWLREATNNAEHMAKVYLENEDLLSQVDEHLKCNTFMAGKDFTLADVVWIPVLARLALLGKLDLSKRPNLKRYFDDAQKRPSWVKASIISRIDA